MADQCTMAELLRAPTESYGKRNRGSPILAEHSSSTHSLINLLIRDQFFRLEKDNPHDHIRWFNKITSTIKYKDVPNSAIKLMLFPFSLAGAGRRWLKKEPPHFYFTWRVNQYDAGLRMIAFLKQFQANPTSAFRKKAVRKFLGSLCYLAVVLILDYQLSRARCTTSSSPSLPISETSDYSLEEFADELAHITFPPGNDDLPFDAESYL
ncbi:hypothetical protein Tco_1253386 [Tanacetum coccineum]